MGRSDLLGGWGEALAAEYLRKKRYEVVACRYSCRFGEIDLIVKNKKYLAFVDAAGTKTFADLCRSAGLRVPYEEGTVKSIGEGISRWIASSSRM